MSIPAGVDVKVDGRLVRVKGPKGELSLELHPHVTLKADGRETSVSIADPDNFKDQSLHGLFRRLVDNMVVGVTKGYEKRLEINGIGFKAVVAGKVLKLEVGFSHDIDFPIPAGVSITVDKNIIIVAGIDKQLVGETAARIRKIKPPEPYLGKGIKYVDETITRKAGKAAKAGSAAA